MINKLPLVKRDKVNLKLRTASPGRNFAAIAAVVIVLIKIEVLQKY